MRISILLILLFGFTKVLLAQFNSLYVPAPIQDTIPPSYLKVVKEKLARDKKNVVGHTKPVTTSIHQFMDHRASMVIDEFNNDLFITDLEFTPYLQRLLNRIYDANPQLPRETTVFAYRSQVPNAMSFGEGTIAITVGLLARLRTEEQILYTLSHELAHYHGRHSDQRMLQLATLYNDKSYKKEMKAIDRSDFGQFSKYAKVAHLLELSMTRHGRENEFAADSLGLVYYLNTTNRYRGALETLQILDSADYQLFEEHIDIKAQLESKELTFKPHWLTYNPGYTWHLEPAEQNDSLRTHPHCEARMAAIGRQLKFRDTQISDEKSDRNRIQLASTFEITESAYHRRDLGTALYNAMSMAVTYPDNAYLKSVIAKSLFKLYVAQKNHELGKVLPLPDPRFPESYDRLLTFLHTLRLSELGAIASSYMKSNYEKCSGDEEFLYVYWQAVNTGLIAGDPKAVKATYQSKFPKGKYQFK